MFTDPPGDSPSRWEPKELVFFDTNVLESRYLKPILLGEPLRDVEYIEDAGYTPCVFAKTIYEIWNHAQLGPQGRPPRRRPRNSRG